MTFGFLFWENIILMEISKFPKQKLEFNSLIFLEIDKICKIAVFLKYF